jgi:hypothetical protein
MQYLNHQSIDALSAQAFQTQRPYPWVNIENILTPEGFERLRTTMPDISRFKRMVGVKRGHGQGYHDRAILHYYPGMDLPEPWREFTNELKGEYYGAFLHRMLGVKPCCSSGRSIRGTACVRWSRPTRMSCASCSSSPPIFPPSRCCGGGYGARTRTGTRFRCIEGRARGDRMTDSAARLEVHPA